MRYILVIFPIIFLTISVSAQKKGNFLHSDFKDIASHHKTIAILPIGATIRLRPNEMKDLTEAELYDMEQEFGFIVQSDIEYFFLNKKRKKGIGVTILDIKDTNRFLYDRGITFHNIDDYKSGALAEILNVDAVIRGYISSTKPNSEDVADLVFYALDIDLNTNKSRISLKLFDNTDEMLWQYEKSIALPYGSIRESTIAPLLKKGARKLPYGQAN